jgi:4-oxalocrotonate tautomerase family enzyme
MPVITIAMHKVDDQVKTSLIRNVTATASETTGLQAQSFTVLIQELDDMNIGLAGKTLREVKAASAH